jgi:hypothetical protein
MATDLRALVAAIRMVAEIERSGDLVSNIMKASRRMYGAEFDPRVRGLIARLGQEVHRLFRLSMDAYVDKNDGLAAALDDMDDSVDALHADYIQSIFESHEASAMQLQTAVQMALVGATTSASPTTPSTSASGSGTWSPAGCPSTPAPPAWRRRTLGATPWPRPSRSPRGAPWTGRAEVQILVTNDDGIGAPGLLPLARAVVAAGHDVVVAAPRDDRSGSGRALGRPPRRRHHRARHRRAGRARRHRLLRVEGPPRCA